MLALSRLRAQYAAELARRHTILPRDVEDYLAAFEADLPDALRRPEALAA